MNTNRLDSDKTLINFLAPKEAHEAFDAICRTEGRSRTSVLLSLMTGFIASEGRRIIEEARLRKQVGEILSGGITGQADSDDRPVSMSGEKQGKQMGKRWDDETAYPLAPLIDDHSEGDFDG